MSHTCPDCGTLCFCNGDIDDCMFDFDEDVNACVHWKICNIEQDYDDYDDSDEIHP